jgi:hypothetical protein
MPFALQAANDPNFPERFPPERRGSHDLSRAAVLQLWHRRANTDLMSNLRTIHEGSARHARHCFVSRSPVLRPKYREVCERAATWAGFDMVDFVSRWLPASIWLRTTMQVWPTR